MLKAGIIEPCNSPYSSLVVLVKKRNGSMRFCIDFRRLNLVTEFDCEPMPNADDIMVKVTQDKYFSKIDLSKGIWQIPLAKESKPLTASRFPYLKAASIS